MKGSVKNYKRNIETHRQGKLVKRLIRKSKAILPETIIPMNLISTRFYLLLGSTLSTTCTKKNTFFYKIFI